MIAIQGLKKSYRHGGWKMLVIRGIDLQVCAGELVVVMGPSGCGKSTLLNVVGCLDTVDQGSYLLNGEAVQSADDNGLARLRARYIGFVFQSFNLLPRRDALQNVALPLLYQGVGQAERNNRARRSLERVGLVDRASHLPSELSGGEQQRVAIARALVSRPKLLIADEPTGSLDSRSSKQVMTLFRELHGEGHTILMVTHDSTVAANADRIVEMRDGVFVN